METGKHKTVVTKAEINGQIVKIDLASASRNSYNDMEERIIYLGCGTYYSYDNTKANNKTLTHFWKFK